MPSAGEKALGGDSASGRVHDWDSKFPGPLEAITVNTVPLPGKDNVPMCLVNSDRLVTTNNPLFSEFIHKK